MPTLRQTEVNVLGYRIDRVRPDDAHDDWHEVLSPDSGDVLAQFGSRAEAERYIIDRELAYAQRAVQRNAA